METGTPPIVIAAYNVLADSYIRPEYYPRCDPKDFGAEHRHPRLIERVANLGADVICLQEVEYALFARLDARLRPLGYQGRWAHKGNGKPDGCSTFVRGPRRCLNTRIVTFDDGHLPKGPSGHVALETLVEHGSSAISIFNTHLKWDTPETPLERRFGPAQAKLILNGLLGGFFPVIVCGDFNAELGSEILETFRADGYADAHDASAKTSNANGRAKKIDFLLYSRGLVAHPLPTPLVADDTPLPSESEPSDHVPLLAAFTPTVD